VDDEGQSPAGHHQVVHDLRDVLLAGPVERLAERDQSERSGGGGRQVLCESLDPADVGDTLFLRRPGALREHVGIGVEADGSVE
jgi:hypothetical protein